MQAFLRILFYINIFLFFSFFIISFFTAKDSVKVKTFVSRTLQDAVSATLDDDLNPIVPEDAAPSMQVMWQSLEPGIYVKIGTEIRLECKIIAKSKCSNCKKNVSDPKKSEELIFSLINDSLADEIEFSVFIGDYISPSERFVFCSKDIGIAEIF